MSIHNNYAHFLANSTAVVSADDPKPQTLRQRIVNALDLELQVRPLRLVVVALSAIIALCATVGWAGLEYISPAVGGEWGARFAGIGLGLMIGIPSLLFALAKAR